MKVMIGVDKSDNADAALKYYLEKLHRPENHVILIHNATIESMAAMGIEALGQMSKQPEIWNDMMKKADQKINVVRTHYDNLMHAHGINVYNVHIISSSDVGQSIVERANDEQVEFIVVGSRGLGTIRRTVFGSVSDYVLHHAKCPVCVVHKPE